MDGTALLDGGCKSPNDSKWKSNGSGRPPAWCTTWKSLMQPQHSLKNPSQHVRQAKRQQLAQVQPWKSLTQPWSSPRQPQCVHDLEVPCTAMLSPICKASTKPLQHVCDPEVPHTAMPLPIHKASTNSQQPSSRSATQPLMPQTHMQCAQDPQGQQTGCRTH